MKTLLPAAIVFCGLFTAVNPAFAQELAFATNTLIVGNAPSSVIAADINGDGKVDLICTDSKDNTLMVLTNNGNGGFGLNATYNVPPSNPTCVVAADINGDGKPDLICAINVGLLVVLTNNGTGGFGSNAVLNVGDGPSCVVAADVNGDGKLDLITADYGDSTLTVLTNNGSGGFGFNARLNVGPFPRSTWPHWVATADINDDGKVDLISANTSAIYPSTIFTNNGTGGFGSNATYNAGILPQQCVVAADINGDGKVDLISANGLTDTLTVLTNNGSGIFGINATYNAGVYPFFVTATDINGDGKLDLVCANAGTNTLTVLTNNGSGGFGFNATLAVGNGPRSIAVADVNGDGKVDLISANYGTNTLTVLTQVIPPPSLTITPISPDAVVVSWPLLATNFVLQTNSDLTTTNWGAPDYIISTNGQLESITINPLPSENLFFRLKQ
jgi:hypothetical protein